MSLLATAKRHTASSLTLAFALICSSAAHAEMLGLPIHGFADVGAAHGNGNDPTLLRGFNVGNIDLYLAPKLGDIRGLIELVFEVDGKGGLATDLERAQIGLPTGDRSVLWFGRFHTPYGYWNTAFHHGAELQTAINRPRFLDFEDKGGVLPSHSVGVWWNANQAHGDARINYNMYVANGNHIATSPESKVLSFNAARDDNKGKLIGGSVAYHWNSDLELGIHGFHDTVDTYLNEDFHVRVNRSAVTMSGLFMNYETDDWDLMFEWYHFANKTENLASGAPGSEGRHNSDLWFAQAGRHIQNWTPYLRIEQAKLDAGDAYFNSMDSGQPYSREAVGVRYDWNANTAFKLELNRTQEKPIDQLDTSLGIGSKNASSNVKYLRLQLQAAISF